MTYIKVNVLSSEEYFLFYVFYLFHSNGIISLFYKEHSFKLMLTPISFNKIYFYSSLIF